MSIWGSPVMTGGGGDKNAYVSRSAPSADSGRDGDYYFQITDHKNALASEAVSNAQTNAGGWEFTVNNAITVIGARAKARYRYTATIALGLSDGTILRETSIALEAYEWVSVRFASPVTLTTGNHYVIMLLGNSGTQYYSGSAPSFTTDQISYVRGRYGSFPGTQEGGSYYNTDILYELPGPSYPMDKQYYKSNGVWTEVT